MFSPILFLKFKLITMILRTQHEFVFVGRDEGSFVENYAYDLGEAGGNSGKIFINLEIQNNPVEAEAIGETIFDTMRKTFFSDLEKDPYSRFEDAVKVVNKALTVLKEEKASKFIGNMNVIIGAVVADTLYITQCGDAEAYLVRKRLLSNVSDGLQDENSEDVFSNIASGTLESGDVIIFNTTRLLRYVSKSDLAKLFSGTNLVASLAELKDFLGSESLGKIALIGINVQEGVPVVSDAEKGKIVSHLQKEEFVGTGEKRAPVASSLNGAVAKLAGAVKSLKEQVSNLTSSAKGRRNLSAGLGREQSMGREGGSGRLALNGWSKEKILAALIILVLLLTVGIWWLRNRAAEQQKIEQYTSTLNEVRDEISSAETTGQYNKDQAGQMLDHARKQALDVLNSGYNRAKATELLTMIDDVKDKLDGVVRPQVRVLADLSSKRADVSAIGMIGTKEKMYAYEYNALYPILLDKIEDVLNIDETENVVKGVYYEDKNSLLFYTKSGKIKEYKDGIMSFVSSADGTFKKGVDMMAYNNKVYILDSANNKIWRYTRRRDSFDTAEAWNANGDVSNGVSFAIDGNIYVLNKDGSISKMFNGGKVDFPIKKAPVNPAKAPTKIFTELDMSQIYVLDPATSRVLVYYKDDKTGGATYSIQYIFEDLKDIRDIYVDKDTNKMYLMDASKVYEVVL